MIPQTNLRISGHARHSGLIALFPLALLTSLPKTLTAQQALPLDSQSGSREYIQTPKPKPSAGHYAATSPQPQAVQQSDQVSPPGPIPDQSPYPRHAQKHQPAPTPDHTPDPTYAQQTHPVPAPNRAPYAGYAQQFPLAPAPDRAQDPGYIAHPSIALNQAPDPGLGQNPGYPQQTYPAPNQAPDSGNAYQSFAAPDQAPVAGYAQNPDSAQNPGYSQDNGQPGYDAQQGPIQQALSPDQLEQLLAPIALYPDALVAQVLAAATYPAQVVGADHWLQSLGYATPDSVADAANRQPWDPSVKALTAFPQILAQMDHDIGWTTDLGNAYYNQPQDVLETIQVLRQRALSAGTLQNTPQEAVTDNQGYLQLAPVNPQVVYVPAYNPWGVYGAPIQPYPGFSPFGPLASFAGFGLRFGTGIAMGAFNATPFGWATWALNWLAQGIFFHHSNYVSHSTTVAHWNRGGGPSRGPTPHPPSPLAAYNRGGNYAHPAEGYRPENRQYGDYRGNESQSRSYKPFGTYARPVQPGYAYNRQESSMTGRPQTYARPGGGYGSSYYGNANPAYGRPATEYTRQQALREPTPQFRSAPQANNFNQRAFSQPARGYAQTRTFAQAQPQRSSGNGFYGSRGMESSHESYRAPKAPKFKAPKEHGGGHNSGGSHHPGGHRF